jgi:hypothetical protein
VITAVDGNFDQALLRQAFGAFPSGVTAFCGLIDGVAEGMAASSFTSVSLDPPLVSVCVANTSTTWPKLARLDRLGVDSPRRPPTPRSTRRAASYGCPRSVSSFPNPLIR